MSDWKRIRNHPLLMSSLRARLMAALLLLVAAVTVIACVVTYTEQRSFLYARITTEATAVAPEITRRLDQVDGVAPGSLAPDSESHGRNGKPPPVDEAQPAEVFGQFRSNNGESTGADVTLALPGQTPLAQPLLPSQMQAGEQITVGAAGNPDLQYRAFAFASASASGLVVVALPLTDVSQTLSRLLFVERLIIIITLLALAIVAWWLVGVGLRPLARMAATADEIAAGDMSRRVSPANTHTEVGRLGLALNSMLTQIEVAFAQRQASEDKLKAFLADAAHELRTPLTSIRGYSELLGKRGALNAEESENAVARIEEQARRMSALIADLLVLARLDEVQTPAHAAVEIGEIAVTAVASACVRFPERDISLVVESDGKVLGDSEQLQRVLDNLIGNAVSHAAPVDVNAGDIEVCVNTDRKHVLVSVRDHGPGLPNVNATELFTRFWRADIGRTRGAAGAGLGLSIVAAIVSAHNGDVVAANAEGGGAVFTVSLPRMVS